MMTRSQGKRNREWTFQVVHIQDPPIDSAASLVLLAKLYCQQDRTIYTHFRMKRLRDKWMKQQMKQRKGSSGLTCAICGKTGLHPWGSEREKATLDHIIPIKAGGSWNNSSNFQVACYRCNNRKDETIGVH